MRLGFIARQTACLILLSYYRASSHFSSTGLSSLSHPCFSHPHPIPPPVLCFSLVFPRTLFSLQYLDRIHYPDLPPCPLPFHPVPPPFSNPICWTLFCYTLSLSSLKGLYSSPSFFSPLSPSFNFLILFTYRNLRIIFIDLSSLNPPPSSHPLFLTISLRHSNLHFVLFSNNGVAGTFKSSPFPHRYHVFYWASPHIPAVVSAYQHLGLQK